MEVPGDQKHWVNQIQKSIVSILRVPPYIGDTQFVDLSRNAFRNRQMAAEENMAYFKTEEIFAGRCNVRWI